MALHWDEKNGIYDAKLKRGTGLAARAHIDQIHSTINVGAWQADATIQPTGKARPSKTQQGSSVSQAAEAAASGQFSSAPLASLALILLHLVFVLVCFFVGSVARQLPR